MNLLPFNFYRFEFLSWYFVLGRLKILRNKLVWTVALP